MQNPPLFAALIPLFWMGLVEAPAHSASLTGLGDLPGGAFASRASAISDDGTVIVGAGNYSVTGDLVVFPNGDDPQTEAFRWEASTGLVGLGFPWSDDFFRFSTANGVSANGAVIAGSSTEGGFRWDGPDDLIAYPFLANAADVSANGEVITATRYFGHHEAVRWDSNDIIPLGSLPGRIESIAYGISSDGAVIVGTTSFSEGRAFRWDVENGMIDLGDLPGHTDSISARRASADGSVIVGWAVGEPVSPGGRIPHAAFRWDAQQGMTGLGSLAGSDFSRAHDVSADGSVVVGDAEVENVRVAFIWDAENGMRRLDEVLESLGVDLSDWSLESATGVSADGSKIVGFGNGPDGLEAWIAVVPEPGSAIPLGIGFGLLCHARRRQEASRGAGHAA